MTTWVPDSEIDALCEPLVQNAAKVKFLTGLGLYVTLAPSGKPKVLRSNLEAVLGGMPQPNPGDQVGQRRQPVKPNRTGFKVIFGGKKVA